VKQFQSESTEREKILRSEIKALGQKNRLQSKIIGSLRKKIRMLSSKKYQTNLVKQEFEKKFSSAQTKIFLNGRKRAKKWTQQDIIDGLILRAFSKRSYQYLRKKEIVPLPGLSTLRNWLKNFKCYPGIQKDVLQVLDSKLSGDLPCDFSQAILSFDEMAVENCVEYHHGQDKVYGPHSKVQVGILRGLLHKWKLPIFYAFDTAMTKSILYDVILQAEQHKAKIRGIACDLGNQKLFSELGFSESQCSFPNPADPSRRVFVFPDVPHLLKLLRNHLLDQGLILGDGSTLRKEDLEPLVEKEEFKILPKLTYQHLECTHNARQRVRLAAQLLSHSTSVALKTLFPEKTRAAQFIELTNDW
jgi:hypothetical protein